MKSLRQAVLAAVAVVSVVSVVPVAVADGTCLGKGFATTTVVLEQVVPE